MKKLVRLKEHESSLSRIYHPSLDYKLIRGTLDKNLSYMCKTDDDGFIMTGNHISSNKKIFLIGGSSVEAIYNTEYLRTNSCLERLLYSFGYDYEVLNAGVSGSTSLNILNVIINKLANYAPCEVILFIPSNDVYALNFKNSYWNRSKRFSTLTPSLSKNDLAEEFSNGLKDVENIYELIIKSCRSFGLNLFVLDTPFLKNIDSYFYNINNTSFKNTCLKREKINSIVVDTCEKNDVNFFSTIDIVKKENFFDDIHMNNKGAGLMADLLFKVIKPHLNKGECFIQKEDFGGFVINADFQYFDVSLNMRQGFIVSHAVLYYTTSCGSENVKNNALFTLNLDINYYSSKELGLKLSENVGFFEYLVTDENIKIGSTLKFYIPENVKDFKIGFRNWRKLVDVVIESAFLVIYYVGK